MKKILKYKKYIIILVILTLAGTGIYFYNKTKGVVQVTTITPKTQNLLLTVNSNGQIESNTVANLSFRATGKITNIVPQEGQLVEKGVLLASSDSSAGFNTSESYKYAVQTAIADLNQYIDDYADDLESLVVV